MVDQVREHLRILSIFHFVVGGIGYLVSLFPVIHLVFGITFLLVPERMPGMAPPIPSSEALESPGPAGPSPVQPPGDVFPARLFGLLFTIVPAILIVSGLVVSTLIVVAGRRLAAHRSHTYCLVVAGIECLFMPFGTVLGVFTILTLLKPEARQCFGLPVAGGDGATA